MNSDLHIERTLRALGSVEPPAGIEARVAARVRQQAQWSGAAGPRSLQWSRIRPGGAALDWSLAAAAVALCGVMVGTGILGTASQQTPSPQAAPTPAPHVTLHPAGGFGAASAVHLPAPAAAAPHAVHGRGHARARTGRALLPEGSRAPLPRGVAVPDPVPQNSPGSASPRF